MKLPKNPFRQAAQRLVANPLPGFDPIYYLYWYRDARTHPAGALDHFLRFGWREGRDPSAGFSTQGYSKANPDVAKLDMNPLIHFLEVGMAEGRSGWHKDPGQPPGPGSEPMKLLAPPRP